MRGNIMKRTYEMRIQVVDSKYYIKYRDYYLIHRKWSNSHGRNHFYCCKEHSKNSKLIYGWNNKQEGPFESLLEAENRSKRLSEELKEWENN